MLVLFSKLVHWLGPSVRTSQIEEGRWWSRPCSDLTASSFQLNCGDRIRTDSSRLMRPDELPLLHPAPETLRPDRARRQAQTVLGRSGKRQRIVILALFAFATPLLAQQGFIGDLYQQTGAGTSVAFNNSNPKYQSWTLMYTYSGAGNFSLELDCAKDATTPGGTPTPGTFSACSNTVTGANPSTQATGNGYAGYITFVGFIPWLETKINSITSGNVTLIAVGFNPSAPDSISTGSGGCVGTAATPCVVDGPNAPGAASTKNPVQVAGNDGTDVQAIATDTSGRSKVVGGAAVGAGASGNPVPEAQLDNAGKIITPTIGNISLPVNLSSVTGENQIIALSGSTVVRISHISFGMSAASTVAITAGTGTNCATGPTVTLWGPYPSNTTSVSLDLEPSMLSAPAGFAICLNLGGTVTVGGGITYAQY